MNAREDERKRGRKRKRERERGGSRASGGRVYINKPREKAPKIIPARRNKSGDAQGEKRDARESRARVAGWCLKEG